MFGAVIRNLIDRCRRRSRADVVPWLSPVVTVRFNGDMRKKKSLSLYAFQDQLIVNLEDDEHDLQGLQSLLFTVSYGPVPSDCTICFDDYVSEGIYTTETFRPQELFVS